MQSSSSEDSTLTSKLKYTIGELVCPKCNKKFNSVYALNGHQNAHRKPPPSHSAEDSDDGPYYVQIPNQKDGLRHKDGGFLKMMKPNEATEQLPKSVAQRKKMKYDGVDLSGSETTLTDPMVGYEADTETEVSSNNRG